MTQMFFLDEDMAEPQLHGFASGQAVVFSSRKPGRSEGPNEDSAGLYEVGKGHGVIAVADGAGGLPGGAKASALAVQKLGESLRKVKQSDSMRSAIMDGFEQANQAILELGIGAATTLAVAEIHGNRLRTYHAGDSAILVTGQRGKLKVVTVGHSPVSYAVESGMLDAQEALHHEDLNLVLNFVGSDKMRIDVGSMVELSPRDTVVVASDGLFDNLHNHEVVEAVRIQGLSKVGDKVVTACRQRMHEPDDGQPSKPDDLTFVVFRLG